MTSDLTATMLRLLTGVRAHWRGCEPDLRQRIYFANHSSHLDAPTLWAALPPALRQLTCPVAARDYWTAGRLRRYLATHVFHAVLVERKTPTARDNPIDDMLRALGDQRSLILFPEGGRFTGPDPVEFKSGLFHLAKKRPDLELIPVLLDNLNRVLPKGELLPAPLIASATFGAPLRLEPDEPRSEFLSRARQAIIALRYSEPL
ncbi:MAG: 1-acyl-sn-glycerol-3-phosphate acyltransferase [Planctomycetes bacterium]|nr:1-acyl-sn-glycerol-3-phosphate acyltransferase [Planctomycetota bacterium]